MAYVNVFNFFFFNGNSLKHSRGEKNDKNSNEKIIMKAKGIFAGYKN